MQGLKGGDHRLVLPGFLQRHSQRQTDIGIARQGLQAALIDADLCSRIIRRTAWPAADSRREYPAGR